MTRRRLGPIAAIVIVVFLVVGIVGTTLSLPAPSASPVVPLGELAAVPAGTPRAAETPSGRFAPTDEAAIVGSCLNGIDQNTVPAPIAQTFCVCVLNRYEQLYPSYQAFQAAAQSGRLTEQVTTEISNRCVQAIVGG
jgi:hypothetical protein